MYDVSLSWFQLQLFKGQIILFSWGFVFETKWFGCEFFMKIIWLSSTWTKFCPKHFSIKVPGRLIDWLVVFNIIFNTQWLYIWWSVLVAEWSTDLRRVTDKLYHIKYGQRCITVTFYRKQSELSIKIYRTNSVNKFGWDKNQQNEIK